MTPTRLDPMAEALGEARAAAGRGEVPVGAVILHNGQIVARAGNRTRELNDPTAHAEILAIRLASEALGAERLTGADLYVTLEPCTMCAAAISFARIRRLYFGAEDEKGGDETKHVGDAIPPGAESLGDPEDEGIEVVEVVGEQGWGEVNRYWLFVILYSKRNTIIFYI